MTLSANTPPPSCLKTGQKIQKVRWSPRKTVKKIKKFVDLTPPSYICRQLRKLFKGMYLSKIL